MTWIISMILAAVFMVVAFLVGSGLRKSGADKIARVDEALLGATSDFDKEWARESKTTVEAQNLLRLGRLVQFAAIGVGVLWIGFHTLLNTIVQVPAGARWDRHHVQGHHGPGARRYPRDRAVGNR